MKKEIKIQEEGNQDSKVPDNVLDINPDELVEDKPEAEEATPEPVDPVVEITDRLQRLAAEFENYKKKNAREFERGREYGMVTIIQRILPALDSFDSALESYKGKDESGVYEGLGKIRDLLVDSLKGVGLEIMVPEPGTPFDPHVHEVMLTLETTDFADQEIVVTLQKGYSFKNTLVRAAKVQIAVEPKQEEE